MSFDDVLRDALNRIADELSRAAAEDRQRAAAAAAADVRQASQRELDELKRASAEERERAVRGATEAAAADVRRHAEAQLAEIQDGARRKIEELQRTAAQERENAAREAAERAAADVRRQADEQIAQIHEAAQREAYEIRHAAAEERDRTLRQVEEERQRTLRQAEEERERTLRQAEEVRLAAEAQVGQLRATLESEVQEARRLAALQADDIRAKFDTELADVRRLLEGQLVELRGRADADSDRARAELAAAREEAEKRIAASDLARASGLVEAVRKLDASETLVETLDALAECAADQVERAAVLVVRPDAGTLRGWRLMGFPDRTPAKEIELDLDAAGLAGAVVRSGASASRTAGGDGEHGASVALPSFVTDGDGRHAMALPLIVGGRVVAVLYADAARDEPPAAAALWPVTLEVLARHASRVLEATTVQRVAGLSAPKPVAPPAHAATQDAAAGHGDEDAARRYARLLVSEIRMYHEPIVDEGRRSRDLRARLGGEIERARRLYEERVPPAIRERSDYFEQELVRTLADGDRSLLG